MGLKLRHRILLLVFGLVTGTLLMSLILVEHQVRDHLTRRASGTLQRDMTLFQQSDEERGLALFLILSPVESDLRLKALLERRDWISGVKLLRESAGSDQIFLITDAQGRLLLRSDRDRQEGLVPPADLSRLEPVKAALQSRRSQNYCLFEAGLWRMASVPLTEQRNGLAGTLTVGYRADQNLVERLAREFDCDASLFAEGKLLAINERCSLPGPLLDREFQRSLPQLRAANPAGSSRWVEIILDSGPTQYRGLLAGLGSGGDPKAFVGILLNNQEALELVTRNRWALGELGAVTVVVALLISIPVVGRLANPVELVETVVQTLGDGLIQVNPDWSIQRVNLAAEKLLETRAHELLEKPFFQVIQLGGSGSAALSSQQLMSSLAAGQTVRYEDGWIQQVVNQTRFASAFVIAPILLEGRTSGAVILFRDITEIQAMRQQLVTFSHQAGMAEVATGTLHNVGNALNSVSVAASLVADKLRSSKLSSLNKTVALLQREPEELAAYLGHDPKGKKVPVLLTKLTQHLEEHQAATLKELETMLSNLEHVKQVIKLQQAHTRTSSLHELVDLSEVFDSALAISQASAASPQDLLIVREFSVDSPLRLEKHKLVQILVNLCCNALESMAADAGAEKRLLLRTSLLGNLVQLEVQDSGGGICAEHLEQLFRHGFTTKPEGHGFGLHNCALAARSMGGQLRAFSPGLGRGATFTLEFPYQQ